jgi:hypothetical protein
MDFFLKGNRKAVAVALAPLCGVRGWRGCGVGRPRARERTEGGRGALLGCQCSPEPLQGSALSTPFVAPLAL